MNTLRIVCIVFVSIALYTTEYLHGALDVEIVPLTSCEVRVDVNQNTSEFRPLLDRALYVAASVDRA